MKPLQELCVNENNEDFKFNNELYDPRSLTPQPKI